MPKKYLTLTLLATLALSGCNSLNNRTAPELLKVATHPGTAPATEQQRPLASLSVRQPEPESTPLPAAEIASPPTPPADLMERLREGFSLEIPAHPRIDSQIRWFTANSDYLDRVQERAAPYRYFIL